MDLDTENRLAALLMEEARRLRREADKEGVHVYLKPNVRGRPNARFLTATVLGVQQANRAAEVGELWRAREKELELDAKQRLQAKVDMTDRYKKHGFSQKGVEKKHEERSIIHSSSSYEESDSLHGSSQYRLKGYFRNSTSNCSSSKRGGESSYSSDDGGLRDDEMDDFLQSRAKRGRGSVGCRMDDPGPYLPSAYSDYDAQLSFSNLRFGDEQMRRVLGPEKPSYLKSFYSHDVEDTNITDTNICQSKKHHSKEKKLKKEKSEKRRRKEKKSRHERKNK
ncbi:hypothetical protein AXF42_Ash003881 [Apostasia shenzhenica]|uniref:Uncharacterized protein n=1 Tax=Apostasia shenzhenica TaxID=1088818 RepID=A0A2I0AI55_9ASPA|nr:hypothetical protein AXF42_Ash003881 [Apostasia shenzhenica]